MWGYWHSPGYIWTESLKTLNVWVMPVGYCRVTGTVQDIWTESLKSGNLWVMNPGYCGVTGTVQDIYGLKV